MFEIGTNYESPRTKGAKAFSMGLSKAFNPWKEGCARSRHEFNQGFNAAKRAQASA